MRRFSHLLWILVAGCATPTAGTGPASDLAWLSSVGFPGREGWESTALFLERREIPPSGTFTVLLQDVPNIRIDRRPRGGWGVGEIRPQLGDTCAVHVYLNGTRIEVADLKAPIPLDSFVPARALDGLELHVGGEGPTFEPDGCGVLLLWSAEMRRREDLPFRGRVEGRVRSTSPDSIVGLELETQGGAVALELEPPGSAVALEPGLPVAAVVPDPEGGFEFRDLLPGTYRLWFLGAGGRITGQDVRVYAHQVSRVDVEMRR